MNRWIKRMSAVLLSFVIILGNVLPSVSVYAAGASASGVAYMSRDFVFAGNGRGTVNLSITGHPASVNKTIPNDVVIIGDCSGSMSGAKIEALRNAIREFSGKINLSKHRIGVVAFATGTQKLDFTTDKSAIDAFVDTMVANGGTYVGPAIDSAVSMLKADRREGAKPTIILLTDGEASDQAAMISAAAAAKDEGFVFYTIALLSDETDAENNGINLQLRKLATTEAHHHFVGVNNLDELYQALADDVGIENPYNVVVTQTIKEPFEYVPGSADKNIPVPKVEGNTLTWNMLEIKNTTINLNYGIRLKDSSITSGRYKVCSESYLTYETYDGTSYTSSISSPYVDVVEYGDPIIKTMSPNSSNEGLQVVVKVTHENMRYDDDFCVYLGNRLMEITYIGASYFKFRIPADTEAGAYTVTFSNHGKRYTVGTYTINVVEKPTITMGQISVTSGDEGTGVTEKVLVTNMESYASDFAIYVDGRSIAPTYMGNSYFKFVMPNDLAVGEHAVTAKNNGVTYNLGTYTVNALPESTVTFGALPVTEGDQGTTPTEKITTSEALDYVAGGFSVTVNGLPCELTYAGKSYFKFKIPAELPVGTYPVSVTYKGKTTSVGNYTVIGEVIPDPEFSGLSVTSGEEGDTPTEKITFTNMESYAPDFAVTIDGNACAVSYAGSSYFKFVIPAGLAAGAHTVVVRSNGKDYTIGDYTVNPKPLPTVTFGTLPVTDGEEGSSPVEKITTSEALDYSAGFSVTAGGEPCEITYTGKSYFKFRIPAGLSVGTYPVVVSYNNGQTANVGDYTVNAIVPPTPEFGSLPVTSGEEGDTPTEKITFTNMESYAPDFGVTVDGNPCTVTYAGSSYFKFVIPAGLSAGTYTAKVRSNGQEYILGDYTVNAKPLPTIAYGVLPITSGNQGDAVTEKVTVPEPLDYAAGFSVTVGGVPCEVTYAGKSYFKFKIPTTLAAGMYDVEVNYKGAVQSLGTYEVKTIVYPDATFGTISIVEGYIGTSPMEKVTVSGLEAYTPDFMILIDGNEYEPTYTGKSYFKFEMPSDLAEGTHDVSVRSNGKVVPIGTYNAIVYVVPPFTYKKTSARNSSNIVKVTVSNITYDDITVYVGGVEVPLTYTGKSYFKINVGDLRGSITVDYYTHTGIYCGEVY